MLENKNNALTDDELTQVSGGGKVPSQIYEGVTSMKCNFCGYRGCERTHFAFFHSLLLYSENVRKNQTAKKAKRTPYPTNLL